MPCLSSDSISAEATGLSVIISIIIIIIIHHAGHRNGERGNCLSGGKDHTGGKDQHIMTAAIYELGTVDRYIDG